MDGWMDGAMDGWMDGWMGGWMDGWTDRRMDGWTEGRTHGGTNGRTNKRRARGLRLFLRADLKKLSLQLHINKDTNDTVEVDYISIGDISDMLEIQLPKCKVGPNSISKEI